MGASKNDGRSSEGGFGKRRKDTREKTNLEGTGNGLHDLGLGSGSDSGDGKTDVDSRSDTLEEELSLQEDLSVGDGNDVGAEGRQGNERDERWRFRSSRSGKGRRTECKRKRHHPGSQ
jgi:hypothetical protein